MRIEIDWTLDEHVKLDGYANWTVNDAKWDAADDAGRREIALEAIASSLANSLWDQLQDKVALNCRPEGQRDAWRWEHKQIGSSCAACREPWPCYRADN
jgi:hypothetical protein